MADIYIYPEDCEDFTTFGLCGALMCDSCIHTEEANGMSEISLTHPIDETGKWRSINPGAIIKCAVPMKRKMPSTAAGGSRVIYYHYLSNTAEGNDLYIYSKRSGGKKLLKVPMYTGGFPDPTEVRTEIILRGGEEGGSGSRVGVEVGIRTWNKKKTDFKFKEYSGFMNVAALDATRKERTYNEDGDIIDQWRVEEQYFRIYNVQRTEDGITAEARHIFYDLLRNSTSVPSGAAYKVALGMILSRCVVANDFEISCSMEDQIDYSCENVNPIEAMIGNEGLLTKWGGELVRNNWVIGVERSAGLETGMRIEYGRNLLGLSYSESREDIVTSIKPIGQTKKGEPLELEAGTYTTSDGLTVTVGADKCVHARNVMNGTERYFADCPEYNLPYIEIMDFGKEIKAAGTKAAQLLAARTRLVAEVVREFELTKKYLPEIQCDVDFVTLGDTDECKEIRGLEAVHLYDNVTITNPKIGVSISAKVNRTQFDCLTERMIGMEIGNIQKDMSKMAVSEKQIPKGVISAINSAGGVAGYASGTVDSKATVTASATAPIDPENGAYWINESDGNRVKMYNASAGAWVDKAVEKVDIVAPQSQTQMPPMNNGIRVEQSEGTYFQADNDKFGLFRTGTNEPVAIGGVDEDGKGFFAANRIHDPGHGVEGYVDLGKVEDSLGYEMKFMTPNFDGVPWNDGDMTPEGVAAGLILKMRNLPATADGVTGINGFHAYIYAPNGLLETGRFRADEIDTDKFGAFGSGGYVPAGTMFSVTLHTADWVNGQQAIDIESYMLKMSAALVFTPAPAYVGSGVYCSGCTESTDYEGYVKELVFKCGSTTPTADVVMNCLALGGMLDIGDLNEMGGGE